MFDAHKKVSVVLGTYNRFRFLKLTIDSIRRELKLCSFSHEIIIVDGGSTDGTLNWLLKQKDILTIVQHNRGECDNRPIERRSWGYFMNLGFKCAQGTYVCMLSDDCLVVPGAIRNGVTIFDRQIERGMQTGAVAFYWRNWPEEQRYRVGLTLGNKLFVNHGLYLNEAIQQVGYIDESTYSFYHADGDLCLKLWEQGYICVDATGSYIEHYSHANMAAKKLNMETQQRDWANYLNKWEGTFYHSEKHNIGGWMENEFNDVTSTADMFKYADPFKWYFKINAFKVMAIISKMHKR